MSDTSIATLLDRARSMRNRASSLVEASERRVGVIVHTAEVAAGAYAAGILRGRYEDPDPLKNKMEFKGVPIDLAAGIGLHVAALAGIGGTNAKHLEGFGDGLIAGYMAALGHSAGIKMLAVHKQLPQTKAPAGELGEGARGEGLSRDELTRLARGASIE